VDVQTSHRLRQGISSPLGVLSPNVPNSYSLLSFDRYSMFAEGSIDTLFRSRGVPYGVCGY
jgi:hypothetical protein